MAKKKPPRPATPGTSGPSGKSATHRDLRWALGLSLLAWVHRLLFLAANRDADWPFSVFYAGDSENFFRHARALLRGELFDNGIPFHPPGFPWFLAFVHTLVGAGDDSGPIPHFAVRAVLALVASGAVGLLYLLVLPYLGRTAALIAALLAIYHFGLNVLAVATVGEGLFLTLLMAALLLWSRKLSHRFSVDPVETPAFAALGLGGLLGALSLVRAEGVLFTALLLGIGVLSNRNWTALKPWAWTALAFLLTLTPWTIRNAVRLAEFNRNNPELAEPLPIFVPLTLYGPLNLALANHPQADGGFSRDFLTSRTGSPNLDFADPVHLDLLLHGGRHAWESVRSDPGGFVRLLGRKMQRFFAAWKLGWTQWDLPGGLDGTRRRIDVFVPDAPWALLFGPPLAVLGLAFAWKAGGPVRRWLELVLLLTAVEAGVCGLFFGYTRLGLLVLPFGLSLVALGLTRLTRSAIDPSPRLLRALGGVALALLALEVYGISQQRTFRATGSSMAGGYINPDDEVRLESGQ